MKRFTLNLIIIAAQICFQQVSAQNAQPLNVVTSSVPFLRISPDSRAGGMGDVGIAISPDVNSVFWNSAKLPFASNHTAVSVNYSPWLRDVSSDMYLATLGAYHQLNEEQAIHASIRYFSIGNLQFTDINGSKLNSFRPREFAIEGGYSRKISTKMGVGISLKYIHSNLAIDGTDAGDYTAGNAVAATAGFYYDGKVNNNGWSFGAVLSNLGSKICYSKNSSEKDYIPANLGLGVAYSKVIDGYHRVQFGLDINKLMVPTPPANPDSASMADYRSKSVFKSWLSSFGDAPGGFGEEVKEFQISIGAEYWYHDQFALRAGYFYENPSKGNRRFFTTGAGIKYNILDINFSYLIPAGTGIDRNPLSNTIRFGLAVNIDGKGK